MLEQLQIVLTDEPNEEGLSCITNCLSLWNENAQVETLKSFFLNNSVPTHLDRELIDARELLSFILQIRENLSSLYVLPVLKLFRAAFKQLCIDMIRRKKGNISFNVVQREVRVVIGVWCGDIGAALQSFWFPLLFGEESHVNREENFFTRWEVLDEIEGLLCEIALSRSYSVLPLVSVLAAFVPFSASKNTSTLANEYAQWMQRILDLFNAVSPWEKDTLSGISDLISCYPLERRCIDGPSDCVISFFELGEEQFPSSRVIDSWKQREFGLEKLAVLSLASEELFISNNILNQDYIMIHLGCLLLIDYFYHTEQIISVTPHSLFYLLLPSFVFCIKYHAHPLLPRALSFLSRIVEQIKPGTIFFGESIQWFKEREELCCPELSSNLTALPLLMTYKQRIYLELIKSLIEWSLSTQDENLSAKCRENIEILILGPPERDRMLLKFVLICCSPCSSASQHFLQGLVQEIKAYLQDDTIKVGSPYSDPYGTRLKPIFEEDFPELMFLCTLEILRLIQKEKREDLVDLLIRLLNFFLFFIGFDRKQFALKNGRSRCFYTSTGLVDVKVEEKRSNRWHKTILKLSSLLSTECLSVLENLKESENALDHFSLSLTIEHFSSFFS